MLSLYEILKASKTGIAPDMWTALAGMNWGGAGSGTETKEITGIPPLSFRADGTPLLDYLISGNMSQSGTPTPQNPIQPQECGERTGNFINPDKMEAGYLNTLGSVSAQSSTYLEQTSDFIPVTGTSYSWALSEDWGSRGGWVSQCFYNQSKEMIGSRLGGNTTEVSGSFQVNSGAVYVRISWRSYGTIECMLNSGSTALPYEPWGYKIPISSANTTTPIYLGEVPTTRKIRKLVLTGEETFTYYNTKSGKNVMNLSVPDSLGVFAGNGLVFCTHLPRCNQDEIYSETVERGISTRPSSRILFYDTVIANTPAGFKSYLAAQYAAGTPVTVWYVLATPTTGIVNEPIRKIGDYADTVSMEQAGVSIPTNNGSTTVDVDTTLKPSEVYIKYKGV